ncbi:MAG: anti-sigma factor [Solirubrobacteraceae bacterium]
MSPSGANNDCEEYGQAAAYVLRALEQQEAERYREHLVHCAVCSTAVSELQPVADSLPAVAPRMVASEALRERIMSSVRAEAELLNAAGAVADRPRRARSRVGLRIPRPQLLTAALALGVGLLIGAIAINTGSSTPAAHVTTAQLASVPAGAHAILRQVGTHAELVVSGISQPPHGKIYELWLAREGKDPQPTDALFGVNNSGNASVNVPGDLADVRRVMVTAEPIGGSLHPTSSPIVIATLQSS